MYTIKATTQDGDSFWIHNPTANVLITGNPSYTVGDNENGSAEFVIYPDHPYYDKVQKLTTDITFYKDDVEVFNGRVLYDDEDFNGVKTVTVEGELGYLNDSLQRPAEYHDISPYNLLKTVLDNHNDQVENRKKFQIGMVTVTDSNDSLYRYSNYETTREWIQDRLVDRLGGHLVIRKESDTRYLDWLDDDTYYKNAKQTIEFGENLLDYAKNVDASELATCIIPLGAQLEESPIEALDMRLDISDVNGGVDYVTDDKAVAQYGRIFKTETWDDVNTADYLKQVGEEYLKEVQYENLVLQLTAIDLNLTDDEIEGLSVGDQVRCISAPNNFDATYPISEMTVYLMDMSQNTFTLGTESKNATYTSSRQSSESELTRAIQNVPTKSDILEQAMREATDLINSMMESGYVIYTPNELIIADYEDYLSEYCHNLWRWGLGGLAHYSDGYYGDTDGIAITMEGQINGRMLLANTVMAESINVGYTESIQSDIKTAEKNAESYAYEQTVAATEYVTNSITNLDNRIALSVVSTKEAIVQKNYVSNGETETLDLESFTISTSSSYTVTEEEYQNVNCIKIVFTGSATCSIKQSMGTLPAGNYTTQCEIAYPDGATVTTQQYARVGYSSSSCEQIYLSTLTADTFKCVKRSFEVSQASREMYVAVYGTKGLTVYIKNIRCLRNFQELLDDVSSSLTVAVNEVSARVSEVYENATYDYIGGEDFSGANSDNLPDGWSEGYTGNGDFDYSSVGSLGYCASISRTSTSSNYPYIRYSFGTLQPGTYTVKFKAATTSGNESKAQIRYRFPSDSGGYTTSAGLLSSSEWTEVEKEFKLTSATTSYLYIACYVNNTTILITDVSCYGNYSSYTQSQVTILNNSITSEVTRATAAETKYGTCSTAKGTTAKVVNCSEFKSASLAKGANICVYFTNENTATSPTLNVNSTGAKSIYAYGKTIEEKSKYNWEAASYVSFTYDGEHWCMCDNAAGSKIEQLADSITMSVSSTKNGSANITLSVDGSDQTYEDFVKNSREAFAAESNTSVKITGGVITFNTKTIVIGDSSSNFYLDADGNVTIKGKIISTSGKIGNWNIDTYKLYSGTSKGKCTGLQTPASGKYAISVGATDHKSYGTGAFRVKHDGAMTATNATITGTITNTGSNSMKLKINNGIVDMYHNGKRCSYVSGNTYYTNTGKYGLRLAGKGCVAILTPYLLTGGYKKPSADAPKCKAGATCSTWYIWRVKEQSNGAIKLWGDELKFKNGIMWNKVSHSKPAEFS